MPIDVKVNLTSIILIIVLIAAVIFFITSYTPGRLKEAIRKYNALRDSLKTENTKLQARIDSLAIENEKLDQDYKVLATKHSKLVEDKKDAERRLREALKRVMEIPLDTIVAQIRFFLNKYLVEELAVNVAITHKDIYKTRSNNFVWSLAPMRTNLSVLTEHNSYKSEIIPNLETQCDTLLAMNSNLEEQIQNQEEVISNLELQKQHEKMMHDKCAEALDICRHQLQLGKLRFLGIGVAVGVPVGILIKSALD